MMDLPEVEHRLGETVATIPSPARAEILRVLTIGDDAERAREIGALHGSGLSPATAELLIDAEEDAALKGGTRGDTAGGSDRSRLRLASGCRSSYTRAVTKKRERRDVVHELQEDAEWSGWTNTFERHRGWGRPRSVPHGVGLRTYMLAALIIFGTVAAVVGLIALLLNLN